MNDAAARLADGGGFPPPGTSERTLCDYCGRACGGCQWSRKGVQRPVPGWDAVRRDILMEGRGMPLTESYVVIRCPEFRVEAHRERAYRRVDWERVRREALGGAG